MPNHFERELSISDPWVDYGHQLELIVTSGKSTLAKFIKQHI
jgi:hypothetical protein